MHFQLHLVKFLHFLQLEVLDLQFTLDFLAMQLLQLLDLGLMGLSLLFDQGFKGLFLKLELVREQFLQLIEGL